MTFGLSWKIVFWYWKSYSDIRTKSENAILICKILFWHSNWVGKSYFDIQNSILTLELSWKMLFWNPKLYFDIRTVSGNRNFCHSKSDLHIRTESENAILTFKILFWHSNWVGKCNLIFKFLFWHSNWIEKWYFDILNPNFNIRTETEHRIFSFKFLFSHSNWVGKCYFDIQNLILTFDLRRKIAFWHSKSYFDIRTESENAILIFKILFCHSNWV